MRLQQGKLNLIQALICILWDIYIFFYSIFREKGIPSYVIRSNQQILQTEANKIFSYVAPKWDATFPVYIGRRKQMFLAQN